jgi:hypothetical protein
MGNLRGLQLVQVIGGALSVGGGSEHCPLVVPEHLEPGGDVGGVVLAYFRSEAEIGAQEGGTQLGDEFLHAIGFIAEAFAAELAGKPRWVLGPVALMPISA